MNVYRVVVMFDRMPGSRYHDGKSFVAVGETEEEASRHALDAYAATMRPGMPAPIGALAVLATLKAEPLDEAVVAVEAPEMKKIAKRSDWVGYTASTAATSNEPPAPAPR